MTLPAEIIVGTARVRPVRLEASGSGLVAELEGAGLRSVIDAAFGSGATVELWSAGRAPRALTVTGIEMQGRTTLVTFEDGLTVPMRLN